MKYKNIVLFTKTSWDEQPRIRHQLSKLLIKKGHKVIFFEKPNFMQFKTMNYQKDNIDLVKHFEFLHHQLKPLDFLVKFNNFFLKKIIKKTAKNFDIDLIINFNYDYTFLSEIFPNNKIITIINDDFIAQAKPWMKESISNQLKQTCEKSDIVFAVSDPLVEKIKKFNVNTYRFFPWADRNFVHFNRSNPNSILIWGYITSAYDFELLEFIASKYPSYNINIFGPVQSKIRAKLNIILEEYSNISYFGSKTLDEIDLENYFACLAPYNLLEHTNAVSITNKGFQVLARGLPLVNYGMPNFIKESFISNCSNYEEVLNSLIYFNNHIDNYQKDIEKFVNDNQGNDRYNYLLSCLATI